jgi:hypothetical protein
MTIKEKAIELVKKCTDKEDVRLIKLEKHEDKWGLVHGRSLEVVENIAPEVVHYLENNTEKLGCFLDYTVRRILSNPEGTKLAEGHRVEQI